MFVEKYKGVRIAVTNSAMQELMKEEKTLYDVVTILEEGYDAPRKRKKAQLKNGLTEEIRHLML